MRTLFLNPPSFEGFDGGASSRWPASREIESYWYPVWLCYPAGMLRDHQIVDFANGKPLEELPGVSFRRNGQVVNNPEGPAIEDLDSLPWVTKVYKRDLDITRYNVPFLLNPFVSLYTSRGCPALCTFCLWPQTHSGPVSYTH